MNEIYHPVEPSGVIFPLLVLSRLVTCPLMVGAKSPDSMASFQIVTFSTSTAVVSLNDLWVGATGRSNLTVVPVFSWVILFSG
jgi:hypothetical protein